MRVLLHFRNKPSGLVAKDRLKLLLVAERMDCSPQMMTMLQNDLVLAAGKYFAVAEHRVEIRYLKESTTFLIKMPLKTDIQKSYPGF
ncbi:MAG: cell division topological specificity factor MinE [Blautia sp.]